MRANSCIARNRLLKQCIFWLQQFVARWFPRYALHSVLVICILIPASNLVAQRAAAGISTLVGATAMSDAARSNTPAHPSGLSAPASANAQSPGSQDSDAVEAPRPRPATCRTCRRHTTYPAISEDLKQSAFSTSFRTFVLSAPTRGYRLSQ